MDYLTTKKRTVYLIIAFLMLSINCMAQPCYEVKKGRSKFNFKLLKKGVQVDTNKIRIDGVYIFSSPCNNKSYSILYREPCVDSTYSYYRFFANGRVYMSSSFCSFPTEEELNDLIYGGYGYYKIEGDTLTIEQFTSGAGGRYYYFEYYEIQDGKITKFGSKKRGWSFPEHKIIPVPYKLSHRFHPCKLKEVATFW